MSLHCRNLNEWIVFFPEHVAPCCIGIDIEPPKMPFAGGTFSMEAYKQWIEQLCRQNQTPQGPCKGCRYLVPTENADADIRFGTVVLSNFIACNAKCSYCNAWESASKPKYELTGPIKFMIDKGLIRKGANFNWIGGEATILAEFPKLFQLIRSHGFIQRVLTNGIKFSPELADGLAGGEAMMELSLDAGTPETYHVFKGRDFFSKVVENLSKYASNPTAARNITLKYIMSNKNCKDNDTDGFIAVCKKLSIDNVVLSPEINENKRRITTPDTIDQMENFVNRCTVEGLSCNIFYELFTDEYKKMLEGRLAKTASFMSKISKLQDELAHTNNILEDKNSQILKCQLQIKEMKKNVGYKIFKEIGRFKKRISK